MSAIRLEIHKDNPQERLIEQAVDIIRKGGVIIYPTDTIYGLGCDINNSKAIDKICRIKGEKTEKTAFSFICNDLKHISDYAKVSNVVFKILKKTLPGPYTFILNATSNVPRLLKQKKKTIGIRIPDNNITRAIVERLGNPIITSSLKKDDAILEYPTDPDEIFDTYENLVDLIIDGGPGGLKASTVVNCAHDEIEILREGLGPVDVL